MKATRISQSRCSTRRASQTPPAERWRARPPDCRLSSRCDAQALLPAPPTTTPLRAAKQAYGGLTGREREIAALIARGKANREIAETLVLSERTVEYHVSNILAKLGAASRAQIAAWATERGL